MNANEEFEMAGSAANHLSGLRAVAMRRGRDTTHTQSSSMTSRDAGPTHEHRQPPPPRARGARRWIAQWRGCHGLSLDSFRGRQCRRGYNIGWRLIAAQYVCWQPTPCVSLLCELRYLTPASTFSLQHQEKIVSAGRVVVLPRLGCPQLHQCLPVTWATYSQRLCQSRR